MTYTFPIVYINKYKPFGKQTYLLTYLYYFPQQGSSNDNTTTHTGTEAKAPCLNSPGQISKPTLQRPTRNPLVKDRA